MQAFFEPITELVLTQWEAAMDYWFLLLSLGFLGFELVRYALKKKFSGNLAADTATNFVTFVLSVGASYLLLGAFYLGAYALLHQWALFAIPINAVTVIACVVLADLAYYWEHRFTHRVGIAWATHTVHHSSPHFNISVAYRFGPMDAVWPIFFHAPLVLLGFHPLLVFFAELVVLQYQTFLHTEVIGKFPRAVEAVMNTPSHHRVHHGSNREYWDKNYGGIFIIWDRLFGTFAEEKAPVVYGISRPVNSVNPLRVFFHGLTRLAQKIKTTPGITNKLAVLIRPPDWQPNG
ncbi:MAG: sterol desaturase family protein [Pseudomonadota bacterium]